MKDNNNKDDKSKKNNKKRSILTGVMTSLLFILFTIIIGYSEFPKDDETTKTYNEFMTYVEEGKIEYVNYDPYFKDIGFKLNEDETIYKTSNPRTDTFKKEMLEKDVTVNEEELTNGFAETIGSIFGLILQYGLLFGLMYIVFNKMNGGTDEMMIETSSTKKFEDVAGLEEVKESLMTTVDMLKNPEKYEDAGARISKGVLLYGPPGTGKTLLAKAIAGEAGINFIAVNGSDFDNKFVGVGADKVRKIFQSAKKQAPCILFIDELDAIGCKRNDNDTSYSRQTLNQLLGCMDGFSASDGIFVFAATNALESLDSALLRPGRFDSRFAIGLPDTTKDREAIIKLYLKNKKLDETVSVSSIAKQTLGCSPAAIEAMLNEAAIDSVKNGGVINQTNIDEAFYRQLMDGHKKKNSERDEQEIKTVAWHEVGHAILGYLQDEEVTKISIIPTTSGAGGVTLFNPKKMGMYSKTELESRVRTLYAGRNAEILLNGEEEITTGASNDIKEATRCIKSMVSHYGMSKYGLLNLDELKVSTTDLLEEYQTISKRLEDESMGMLKEHEHMLSEIADILIEKETLDENELAELFAKLDPKENVSESEEVEEETVVDSQMDDEVAVTVVSELEETEELIEKDNNESIEE